MADPDQATPPPLEVLLDTLDLETIDRDLFRGKTPPTRLQRIFGGQVAAQALVAAQRTVPDKAVHSLHAYFLRPGDTAAPVVYEVDRIRDGRTYATRRVVGIQNGKAIFNLQASFHVDEAGYDHQLPFPGAPVDPAALPPWRPYYEVEPDDDPLPHPSLPFELRVAPPAAGYSRLLWFRTAGPLPDDPMLQRCVAAYASDMTLLSVAFEAYSTATGIPLSQRPGFVASLDHAMWFHRPFRVDQWMLYAQSSPSSGDGRGLCQGQMFAMDGQLAITVVQEGALRPPR
jgi:acyl-CoA thioesterase-2